MTLTLDIPAGVEQEKMERLAIALYDAQALTQGQAAAMAGMSRVEFFDALGRHGVTTFQYDWEDAVLDGKMLAGDDGQGNR